MKSRLFLSAIFRLRNMGILLVALGIAAALVNSIPAANVFAYPAAVVVYIISIFQSLMSKKFHEKFNHRQKIKSIQNLNYACLRLSHEAKRHTNPRYAQKLRKVMEDKDDIVNSFFRGEQSFLKEKIVEQTLNLVASYIKLLTNFCIRNRELSDIDVSDITNRINQNLRKLSFVKDPIAAEDLKRVIEMDEKIINRLKDEKQELERIGTKLDYMESTVNMFRHQIISSIESEEMLETLETAVNEASALDSVLEGEKKKSGKEWSLTLSILCGVDIVEVERIKKALEKSGYGFKNKVFTDQEIDCCEKKNSTKYQSYAARFAAKEAVSKAFGTGISDGLSWKDIEVINDSLGKPSVILSGKGKELFEKLGAISISISLSHAREYAVAYAVIETE